METTRMFIIGCDTTEHNRAVFGILPIKDGEPFDFEAKAITSTITVIKEAKFDKTRYHPNTKIAIIECLPSQVKRENAETMTMRWGGNIAHITTAGEYDPKNRRKWRSEFWKALHR